MRMHGNFEKFNTVWHELAYADDIVVRELIVAKESLKLIYVDDMVDSALLAKSIVSPILTSKNKTISLELLCNKVLTDAGCELLDDNDQIIHKMLSGFVVIFTQRDSRALCVACQGYEKRSITEPPTSAVLRGPREGFIEDSTVNISLIRRRVKSKNLAIRQLKVGRRSATTVSLIYLANVADDSIVQMVEQKIKKIDIDGIVDSFFIQSFLEDENNNFFKQVGNSEKPDVIAAKIFEGRVAIVVDGSPIVLTVPYILFEDFQSADDYYAHPYRATFARCIRILGILLAIMLPGVYVAMQSYHYSLFPSTFLISLLNSIETLSFPPLLEILFVLFLFEILSEASIRMPKYLGMALSIVGALILGDTAVKAGLISSPSVMMVAISSICLYTVPDQVPTASLLRVIFTVLGGVAGFFGVMLGIIFVLTCLVSMDSYGSPYLAPYAPYVPKDLKDALVKHDLKDMFTRPESIPNKNKVRMHSDNKD